MIPDNIALTISIAIVGIMSYIYFYSRWKENIIIDKALDKMFNTHNRKKL